MLRKIALVAFCAVTFPLVAVGGASLGYLALSLCGGF